VSIIIRRYTDHMKVYCFFHILLVLFCITVYTLVCFVCFYLILNIMFSYCSVYVFLLLCISFCFIVLFCALFVCQCVLYYCHQVSTQLQLTNISYILSYHMSYIISYHIISFPFVLRTRNMSPDMHVSTIPLCYWRSSEQFFAFLYYSDVTGENILNLH